jgi:hypothetical protein
LWVCFFYCFSFSFTHRTAISIITRIATLNGLSNNKGVKQTDTKFVLLG